MIFFFIRADVNLILNYQVSHQGPVIEGGAFSYQETVKSGYCVILPCMRWEYSLGIHPPLRLFLSGPFQAPPTLSSFLPAPHLLFSGPLVFLSGSFLDFSARSFLTAAGAPKPEAIDGQRLRLNFGRFTYLEQFKDGG